MATMTINGIERDVCEANGVKYYQDWERSEGGIYMVGAKTINRYLELKAEQPKSENYGVFFAFNDEQFKEGYNGLIRRGFIKDGDKVCAGYAGMYGTKGELTRYLNFYKEREEVQKKECNPQEVYFYEWNNHECMFAGDDSAMEVVISLFGNEAAHKIHRVYAETPTNILAPLTERDKHLGECEPELRMLGRLKFDCCGFFSEDDCRYHRPCDLWGGNIKRQIEEMRKLYRQLPDDIKDASCMTSEEIEDYAKRFEEWANEEFSKPKYDPVPRTERKDFPEQILLEECLYYRDDDGKLQKPDRIWFTGDSRRWHQNEKCTHGRAMTSYLGKHGTTLTAVVYLGLNAIGSRRALRRDDLCDVSCKVGKDGWHTKLYDFHYE